MMAPIFEKWEEEYPTIKFVKVDVDESEDVSQKCGIQAMPTFQFFKDGVKIQEIKGANQQKLKQLMEQHK